MNDIWIELPGLTVRAEAITAVYWPGAGSQCLLVHHDAAISYVDYGSEEEAGKAHQMVRELLLGAAVR